MTITLTREEAQQVLDASDSCEWYDDGGFGCPSYDYDKVSPARETLRARLSAPEPEQLDEIVPADEEQLKRIAKLVEPEPEPVAWQSRMRPDWEENGWTQWKDCPKEQADNFWKTPRLHDWVYEARALYTAPPQREWQGLTAEDLSEIPPICYEGAIWADGRLREKNNGY